MGRASRYSPEVQRLRTKTASLDFVLDVLENGRRVRLLAVVDDFTRACLAIEVDPRSAAIVSCRCSSA
jgi:transposase InsO family protein